MKARLVLIAIVLLMAQCVAVAQGSLALSIVEDQVAFDEKAFFNVIVTNVSQAPVRLWDEGMSWGYYGLKFELTDEVGKKWLARKRPISFTFNAPVYRIVAPQEKVFVKICPGEPGVFQSVWEGFPTPGRSPVVVSMQAVLEFKPDEESEKLQVWTGRVVSQAKKFTFSPP